MVLVGYDLTGGIARLWSYWWYWKAMILLVVLEGYGLWVKLIFESACTTVRGWSRAIGFGLSLPTISIVLSMVAV